MKKVVIVFGNDHTNSVGVIQSLGIAGYRSIGLLYGIKTNLVKNSKYTETIITAKDPQTCIEKLLQSEYICNYHIPIIATCDLAALTLERNTERLSKHFVFGHSIHHTLEYVSKKGNQVILASNAGFNVPKSWNINDSKAIPDDISFPCLIKPLVSCEGAKSDIRVCRTRNELDMNLNSIGVTKNVLIQQYIERDYEISILGCGLSNGNCIIPAIENKLTLFPKYVGLECLANMQPLEDGPIKTSVENLITSIGYVGLFSVEMMHCIDDNQFYFTEINLRNDGAEAFVTKYGANLPLNHVEDMLGLDITKPTKYHPGYYIWDMHHLKSLLHFDISPLQWAKEIVKSKGFLMFSAEDPKPFFTQYAYLFLKMLKFKHIKRY